MLLFPALLAPFTALVPDYLPQLVWLKVVLPTWAVCVAPGTIGVLALNIRERCSLVEVLALGTIVSLAAAAPVTVMTILLHVPISVSAELFVPVCLALALWTLLSRRASLIDVYWSEVILLLALSVVAALLYLHGSPFNEWEEQAHISVARRLGALARPGLANIFYGPDLPYTYPFPATHFLFAAISRLGGVDVLFVYDKLRFFWGPCAIAFLYVLAQRVFRFRPAAVITAFTALVLALNGGFGPINGSYWGQLFPYSHDADVAMTVYLPGLLMLFLFYVKSRHRHDTAAFFLLTCLSAGLLIIAHTREAVQFVVYVGAFALLIALLNRRLIHPVVVRSMLSGGAALLMLLVYNQWHQHLVWHNTLHEDIWMNQFVDVIHHMSFTDWFATPLKAPMATVSSADLALWWNPLALIAGSVVLLLMKRNTVGLFIAAGTIAYLAIMRFPFLTVPYIYFSYSEALTSPLRNLVLFDYMMIGGLFFIVVRLVSRVPVFGLRVLASLVAGLVVVGLYRLSDVAFARGQNEQLLFALPLLTWAIGVALYHRRSVADITRRVIPINLARAWPLTFAGLLLPVGLFTVVTADVPFAHLNRESLGAMASITPDLDLERLGCQAGELEEHLPIRHAVWCAPSAAFDRWAQTSLPLDAVLAVNPENIYMQSMFVPQQAVPALNPIYFRSLFEEVFPVYNRYLADSLAKYASAPFFNVRETMDERIAFLRAFGISYVVIDPYSRDMMIPILANAPQIFRPLFDDGRWAVYAVALN